MQEHKNFWDKNAGRYDRFMRKDAAAYMQMYALLRSSLPESSIVSVGHRSTLFAQHEQELHLTGDGSWQLRPIAG